MPICKASGETSSKFSFGPDSIPIPTCGGLFPDLSHSLIAKVPSQHLARTSKLAVRKGQADFTQLTLSLTHFPKGGHYTYASIVLQIQALLPYLMPCLHLDPRASVLDRKHLPDQFSLLLSSTLLGYSHWVLDRAHAPLLCM